MARRAGRTGRSRSALHGVLKPKHKLALDLVASGMTQTQAARVVGFSTTWVNSIIHTSEEARNYLEASRSRIQAKYRLWAEASVNEHLKAIFADELGLSEEERGKLAVSRAAAIQAGMSPTVARAAGLFD
jgi:predicted transcriptional regulator